MRKTWRNIIIVSLVMFIIEIAGGIILLYPHYKTQRLFDSIEDGQWKITQEYYNSMNSAQQQKVLGYLDDFGAWACKGYIDGEHDYEHTAAIFDAINSIQTDGSTYNKYMPDVNHNEYKRAVNWLWDSYVSHDNAKAFDAQNMLAAVTNRVDTNTRDSYLIEMLNDNYYAFLNENMSSEKLDTLCSVIENISYYEAYEHAIYISSRIEYVMNYRNNYKITENLCADNEYIMVMLACATADIDPMDSIYREKYLDLYESAYSQGLIYYKDKITSLINVGDKEGAVALMNTVAGCYGDAFDLSFAKNALTTEWQRAYMEIVSDVDSRILSDLTVMENGSSIIARGYENVKPDSLMMYDIDDNGIPELFLFNSTELENDKIGCFIYSYDNETVSMVGYVNLFSLCSDSNLIVYPSEGQGEAYSLMSFSGGVLSEVSTCQHNGDSYMVDYGESNDASYLSARTSILSHQGIETIKTVGYSNISNGEDFIMAYK